MGDFSRWSFDALRDFSAILSQQGRVDTDADRNEWMAILARRIQAGTLDTLGRAVVPRETPNGFHIEASGGNLTIGCGRIYVDGLLAENHGEPPRSFDPHLAELAGSGAIAFEDQPYQPFLKGALQLPQGGPHLVYIKVWNREVTAVIDPRLIEKALGVDTTARLQTVWQAKLLANVGAGVTCDTALVDVPGFADAEPAADGRLTSKTVTLAGDPQPCEIPPAGGYKGLENQLYRIEIHTAGDHTAGSRATFKWSRDNATVASRVTSISSPRDRIVVESLGRDEVLSFSSGDWVEITDDWRELQGLPGDLRRVAANGVEESTRTLTLETPLTAGLFPVDAQGNTTPARNTRVQRWDQSGTVHDEGGGVVIDLDAAGTTGIPVPDSGTFVVLENGIAVAFDLDAAGGRFRAGDYWLIAARTADASIDLLDHTPPLGIHAHYAKLAIVTFPETETNCPTLWPPDTGGGCCDCTVCVTPDSHASGALTLQAAINNVRATGGTVCVATGSYVLTEVLSIQEAGSLRVRGQGTKTLLVMPPGGEAIHVEGSVDVTLENFSVLTQPLRTSGAAIAIRNSMSVALRRLLVTNRGTSDLRGIGISLSGAVLGTEVLDSEISADIGVQAPGLSTDDYLVAGGIHVGDSAFFCSRQGLVFGAATAFIGAARVTGNDFYGCADAAITAVGGTAPGGSVQIASNLIETAGDGIVVGMDDAHIDENDIRGRDGRGSGDGIVLSGGLDPTGIEHVQILANRVLDMGGGVAIRTVVNSAMIKLNVLARLRAGGIVMEAGGRAGHLVVENNQLLDIEVSTDPGGRSNAMCFVGVDALHVRSNVIHGFARLAAASVEPGSGAPAREAILAIGCPRAFIADNQLAGISPVGLSLDDGKGIRVLGPFELTVIESNSVRRRSDDSETLASATWTGIEVSARGSVPGRAASFSVRDVMVAETPQTSLIMTHTWIRLLPGLPPSEVAVRDNEVEVEMSTRPPLGVSTTAGCRMNDNRVAVLSLPEGATLVPTIVNAGRAIVSGNDFESPGGREARVLVVQAADPSRAAIVGNVRSGMIFVNGAALADPFAALNPFSA